MALGSIVGAYVGGQLLGIVPDTILLPVLAMIMVWGNKYASPNGIDTQLVDDATYERLIPVVVDSRTGKPIDFTKIAYAGGPANSPGKAERLKARGVPLDAAS